MKNILIIISFTLREALARKVFIFFIAVSVLFLLGLGFAFSLMDTNQILSSMSHSNNQFILEQAIGMLEVTVISPLSFLCLLLGIFSTASFVPNMLEKGNIDLLLSKPISRSQLIIGKYLGSILFILINIGLLILRDLVNNLIKVFLLECFFFMVNCNYYLYLCRTLFDNCIIRNYHSKLNFWNDDCLFHLFDFKSGIVICQSER